MVGLSESPPSSDSQPTGHSDSDDRSSSTKKSSSKRVAELIKSMNVYVPPPIMEHNVEPGNLGSKYKLQTNLFGLKIMKDTKVFVSDLTIMAETVQNKIVELTKKTNDDYLSTDRRSKCVQILCYLFKEYTNLFEDRFKTYYDGQSIIYTLYDIFEINPHENVKKIWLQGSELEGDLSRFNQIHITVKRAQNPSFILSPDTIACNTANLDLENNDRTLIQFQDIVCNQYALMNPQRHYVFENGKSYLVDAVKEGLFPADIREIADGKQLLVGAQKTIKQIEGPLGRGTNNSGIVIDSKRVAFHKPQNLADKTMSIIKMTLELGLTTDQREKVAKSIAGLFVRTTHLEKNKALYVVSLSSRSLEDTTFTKDDIETNVFAYFMEKYGIEIKYPKLPPVLVRENGRLNAYPMEVLEVLQGQRAKFNADNPAPTKESVIFPNDRQFYIKKVADALNLFSSDNLYLHNAGIKVFPNPMKIEGRSLINPVITYANGFQSNVDGGKWLTKANAQYLKPATCERWALYCFPDTNDRFDIYDLRSFATKYMKHAERRGLRMEIPLDVQNCRPIDIEERLAVAAQHHCTFVLCVVGDMFRNLHKDMKYYERKYEVVTQQIKCSNMCKIMIDNKMLILENCVNKTNCKLGGLNFGIDVSAINGIGQKWFTPERLIIGIGLASHPVFSPSQDVTPPTFVGYSANMKESPYEFVGDFFFQEPKLGNMLTCIGEIVENCVKRHMVSHDGAHCSEIIIYRSRLDEGSYHQTITREVPHIKAVLRKMNLPDIPIVYIAVSKEHVLRFMKQNIDPSANATVQNISPGIVCDEKITHPSYKEFYLNSHTTLQGTAQTPRYTVLLDELCMTNDELEGQTWALSFGHQIVNLTVSLPCCLYIAIEYASRGGVLWKEFITKEQSGSENTSGYDDAIRKLCFQFSNLLYNKRVNA